MKKNKFMKLASGLLVLCLMTTCVIGATLAKYVTAKEVSDQARVAKWGVRISAVTDSAFETEYTKTDTKYTGGLSVKSSTKVVAPGTEGSAAQFSISGTPEVAVRLSFKMENVKEVFLKAGTYTYATEAGAATITLDNDYYPMLFTLNLDGSPVHADVTNKKLSEIATYLETYSVVFAPGQTLESVVGEKYTLSWKWEFENGKDVADTVLGDIAANASSDINGGTLVDGTDYRTTVSYDLTITATQID